MVNNCDFCGIEIKRHVFCSPSCKTRFHRGDKVKILKTNTEVKERIKPLVSNVCKHGMMKGLCKHGC